MLRDAATIPDVDLEKLPPGRHHKRDLPNLSHGLIKGDQGFYDVLEQIGEGATSIVKKIRNRGTNKIHALKIIPKKGSRLTSDDAKECYEREYRILLSLGRIDSVRIETKSKERITKYQIVMDFAEGVELYDLMHAMYFDEGVKRENLMNELKLLYAHPTKLLQIGLNILLDLYKLHQAGILLIDDKMENIMVDLKTLKVLRVDFGFAEDKYDFKKNPGICMGEFRGTHAYSAPEVLQAVANQCETVTYNKATDIYTVGATLRQLLMGEEFEIFDYRFMTVKIKTHLQSYLKDFRYTDIEDLLLKTTSHDPNQRPSLEEIIEPFEVELKLDKGSSIAKLIEEEKMRPQLSSEDKSPSTETNEEEKRLVSESGPEKSAKTPTMNLHKLTDTQLQTAVNDYIKEKNRFFGIRWWFMSESTYKIIQELKKKESKASEEVQYKTASNFISENPHTTFAKKLAFAMQDENLIQTIHDARPCWRRCFG